MQGGVGWVGWGGVESLGLVMGHWLHAVLQFEVGGDRKSVV